MIFFLILSSPIHVLSDDYLFSAHMVLHLVLLLIVPPLFLLSLPLRVETERSRDGVVARTWGILTRPLVAWFAGIGSMWIWHVPWLFAAASRFQLLHKAQIISLVMAGTIFWWPIIGPQLSRRLRPMPGIFYLFTACVGCTILGILITFAPAGLYSVYLRPADERGFLLLIRDGWGLTPKVDQQLGGLLMWVPPCVVYVSAILGLLMQWLRGNEPARVSEQSHLKEK
jgi:putative membrane protein